jgi:hypothetical protein
MKRIVTICFLFTCWGSAFGLSLPDSLNVKAALDSTLASREVIVEASPDFLEEGLLMDVDPNDSILQKIEFARSILAKVRAAQNFIKSIDASTKFELPVGISKSIGGINYDVAIYAVRLKPLYAELDVVMQVEIPQNGKELTFMAKGIKLSNQGGIVGDATLQLVGDYGINFSGDKVQLILKGGTREQLGGTYAIIDCDGFKEIGIDANVVFSRDLLLPENLNGTIQPEGRVTTSFKSIITNWNDLLVQVSLPNFQVKGLTGFGFTVDQAVFDFSDLRNSPSVVFPKGYTSSQMLPDNQNLWRGFYVRQLSIRLPQQFKNKDNARTSLTAFNMLIDNQGVSGLFEGKNLIPISKGDMNGWAFSLDSLGIELQANQLVQAGFNGGITIPISGEQKSFDYKAIISTDDNYVFNVLAKGDLSFPMFQAAKVDIYRGSSLEVRVLNGAFLPKATLHGRMNVQAKLSEGGRGLELADIRFENLRIQSVSPYIQVGTFSFGSEALQQLMAGFPVSISEIGLRNINAKEVGLDFRLKLNLVGESNGAFAADAGLTIVGNMSTETGLQSWRFKNIDVRDIEVDINGGAFKFKGRLVFYKNDIVYGDGFNGIVDADFASMVQVKASAIFGNVKGMRYWYADAKADFKPSLLIFPGVAINGFGGGACFKMKMDKTGGSELGKTASGIVYVPSPNSGLDLKASVSMSSFPKEEAFNADATFEISFFPGGGVRYMAFMGNAFIATGALDNVLGKIENSVGKMLSTLKKSQTSITLANGLLSVGQVDNSTVEEIHGPVGPSAGKRGAISARVFISYDFENSVLHGNFNVGIDVASIITGGGEAVLHFAPSEWYVYIGTPDNRFNLGFGVGSIKARADAYFMVGTKIPGSPPPPEAVSRILGGRDFNYMKDLNEIGTGGGFAFGSSFSFSTGNLNFLIFYARFEAGVGFDIMLKNYGDVRCEGNSSRIGVNGWYANGQVYAYFEGSIGIHVDLFLVSGDFEILSIGAAAILQAQFPNPFWMQGTVGGRFSILGGLVSGSCSFQVTIGNKCKLVQQQQNVLSGIRVISQMTPSQGEKEVNVFNAPQAVFNMPVNKTFNVSDKQVGKTIQRSFRIKLEQFKFFSEGKEIIGAMQWSDAQDVVAFNSVDVLPPKKEIKGVVEVSFEESISGTWTPALFQGKRVTEKLEITFATGTAPDYIPHTNIEYTYPVIGQLNYYKDETREGYIKLKQGQPYLFEPGAEWNQVGRFTSTSGKKSEFGFAYNAGLVTFSTPSDLQTNQLYAFELLNVPKQAAGAIDRNVTEEKNKLTVGNESTDTEIKTKKAEGSLTELEEKAIFTSQIRSSKYSTLAQKISAHNLSTTFRVLRILWRVHSLKTSFNSDEPFDKIELYGNNFTQNKPLVSFEADLSDNRYYKQELYPLIYEGYPLDGNITIANRTPSELGIPPVRALRIIQSPDNFEMNQADPQSSFSPVDQYYWYDLPYTMSYDFAEIQNKVANRYLSQTTTFPRMEKILWSQFPIMLKGIYKVNVQYSLPAKQGVNSFKQIILDNPIGD